MVPAAFLLLCGLLLAAPSCTRCQKRAPARESPLDRTSAQTNFDPRQFAGKWFLVAVASQCRYLSENSHQLEATNMVVSLAGTAPATSLLVSTFCLLDGICWNIKQIYFPAKTSGRFRLKGRGRPVDIAVVETDYSSYAIVFYEKDRKISAKLYGRSPRVSDAVVAKFERHISGVALNEDTTYYFPVYGFCDSADQFHILDETKYLGAS